MPKEVIRFSNEYVVRDSRVIYNPDSVQKDEEVHQDEQVTIHWDKGAEHVQISIQYDAEKLRKVLEAYDKDEWLGEVARDGLVPLYTDSFTRYDVQRMIRVARKARDDAFGADE